MPRLEGYGQSVQSRIDNAIHREIDAPKIDADPMEQQARKLWTESVAINSDEDHPVRLYFKNTLIKHRSDAAIDMVPELPDLTNLVRYNRDNGYIVARTAPIHDWINIDIVDSISCIAISNKGELRNEWQNYRGGLTPYKHYRRRSKDLLLYLCGVKDGVHVNFTKSLAGAICFSEVLKGVSIATLGVAFTTVLSDPQIIKMLKDRKVTISAQQNCSKDAIAASILLNERNIENRVLDRGAEWQFEI